MKLVTHGVQGLNNTTKSQGRVILWGKVSTATEIRKTPFDVKQIRRATYTSLPSMHTHKHVR